MPTLKTFDGFEEFLTEGESLEIKKLMNAGQKYVHIHGNAIAISSIAGIFKDGDGAGDHQVGILHDGSTVVRQFGQWFCQSGDRDEKGYYIVRPDPNYYPEVAVDTVPSRKEFEKKYAALPPEDRKRLMIGDRAQEIDRYLNGSSPTNIKDIIASRNQ